MLYNFSKSLSNSSNFAAVHAKRQTVMSRNSAFIHQLVLIWDSDDIIAEPVMKYPKKDELIIEVTEKQVVVVQIGFVLDSVSERGIY